MKTIFITGASTGLGKAAATLFHNNGWKVIATMRNTAAAPELAQLEHVTILELDVTNALQIEKTIAHALTLGDIDVVFNNAGYGLIGPLEALSDEQITKQLNTNLLGVIRVTKAFIPYFRQKRSGLFITTTSIGGHIAFPLGSTYHATKWALEGWSESMAFELNAFGANIKTVAPGGIKTDFMTRSLEHETLPAYETMTQQLMSNAGSMMENASTPEQIAAVVYEAATDGKQQLRYIAGEDAQAMYQQRQQLGGEAFRKQLGEQFLQ